MRPFPPCDGVDHTFVDAGGLRTHVALAGPPDGPAVVLLHGWPQHWWMWRDVIPALAADGLRVVVPDLRGHGWTDAPDGGYDKEQLAADIIAALDALEVERFAVAGHDWGGHVAQLLALHHPERVSRLAILNIAPVWGDLRRTLPRAWRFAHVALNASPVVGRLWPRTALLRRILIGVPDDAREEFAAPFREPARAHASQLLYRAVFSAEVPRAAGGAYDGRRLTIPVLVLHGVKDPVIRPAIVEGFRDHGDDVTIEFVPDAGHFVVDERPDLVAQRLTAWFAAVPAAA